MPSPFPGMDPYLEASGLWPDVHNRLIAAIADDLSPRLLPRYYVALEERTYVEEPQELVFVGRPDLAVVTGARGGEVSAQKRTSGSAVVEVEVPVPDRVRETYLEVRGVKDGEVVTVLELLSHSNKRPGRGRRRYLRKRDSVLGTETHLVEVDLLRAGEGMPLVSPRPASDYSILVSRSWHRGHSQLRPFGVRDPIPTFPLPLREGEDEPAVALGSILSALYDRAGYALRVSYRHPPEPPLREQDAEWARELLEKHSVS